MMVDPGRVRKLLDRLTEETKKLGNLGELGSEELLSDPVKLAAVKYGFVVAIEVCIDVGQDIISSESLRAPSDFADAFAVLGEAGVLSAEMVPGLQQMARFRNLLVHGYTEVDDRRVLDILTTRLADFDQFKVSVARAALE